jgi:hypothetical protein
MMYKIYKLYDTIYYLHNINIFYLKIILLGMSDMI